MKIVWLISTIVWLLSTIAFADYQYGGLSNNQLCRVDAANTWSIGGQIINSSQQGVVNLSLASTTGQYANLLSFLNSTGTTLSYVDSSGKYVGDGSLLTNLPSQGGALTSVFGRTGVVTAANDYTWAQITKTVSSLNDITTRSLTTTSASNIGLTIASTVAQTANLLAINDSSGTTLSYIDPRGLYKSVPFAFVSQQTVSTDEVNCVSGAWRIRGLNTLQDAGTGMTLVASTMSNLPNGTYAFECMSPAFGVVNRHQIRLWESTNSSELCSGTQGNMDSGSSSDWSFVKCIVNNITVASTLQIQHRCQTSATTGFGRQTNAQTGAVNTMFSNCKITRIP